MNTGLAKIWKGIKESDKQDIFKEAADKIGLPPAAIEKDWWVVRTLEIIFSMDIAQHTVFKGGTSLSKAWNLIDRFSEDIDLALDRKFLGFNKEMTGAQVSKLRKHCFKYISEKFFPSFKKAFQDSGFDEVNIKLRGAESPDQDPLIIELYYPLIADKSEYLSPRVLVEIGSRSLIEPFSSKQVRSFVGEYFSDTFFADKSIAIPTVNPERTFFEKIFLLHEEFQKPAGKMKVDRLSRHLYDIEKMMDTEFEKKALSDKKLYEHIVEHRKTITPLRGIDYSNHIPKKINFIPSSDIIDTWEKDYEKMQENMIYAESLTFEKLLKRLKELKEKINAL
ncbi:MAG: nucleotidyl transferase AbiEii/AbiGii toxin family protein [Bacteroidia bacterium]|nr:nucleotidyl transferase AbiEii/AbiGii toxin family protein [Bacteroidia bacterium]